ncbi:kinase-like protein [Sistotremastrum niveocremeum HHB9708]|uniref:Kinase-like protein n=1 Tax=Sistotremastrum niveocremeum HHB9708 TaxID=1314777 RepID=A0A164PHF2_9AGAM|nr:kinase-like protein [Sistotremastrum niveocremeum HHB9708]
MSLVVRSCRAIDQPLEYINSGIDWDTLDVTNKVKFPEEYSWPVGTGGNADIYLAELDGKVVAVKVPRYYGMDDEDKSVLIKKIKREIGIWARLCHSRVLPFIGYCSFLYGPSEVSTFSLVSPWMRNGTISNYVHRYQNADVSSLLIEVCEGLEYLHAQNIVHGDLKPSNVFISDDGHAVLADFGNSRSVEALIPLLDGLNNLDLSHACGTSRYMAPELFEASAASSSTAADIWALGCVLLEIGVRALPYESCKGDAQVMSSIMNRKLPYQQTLEDFLEQKIRLLFRWSWQFGQTYYHKRGIGAICSRCWETCPLSRPRISTIARWLIDLRDESLSFHEMSWRNWEDELRRIIERRIKAIVQWEANASGRSHGVPTLHSLDTDE